METRFREANESRPEELRRTCISLGHHVTLVAFGAGGGVGL